MAVGAAGVGEAAAMALDAASDGAVQAGAVAMALDAASVGAAPAYAVAIMADTVDTVDTASAWAGDGLLALASVSGQPRRTGAGVILATTVVAITRRITVAPAAVGSTQSD